MTHTAGQESGLKPTIDQLAILRRLRSEGQISDEEYQDLSKEFIDADVPAETTDDVESVEEATDEEESPPSPVQWLAFRTDLFAKHIAGLLIASAVLALAGALGMLSWLVVVPAILVVGTTLIEGWGKVTAVGALIVAGILVISLVGSMGDTSPPAQAVAPILPPQEPDPPVPGSLDVYMGQLTDRWNTVDGEPRIVKGLTRHNETGEYDTFIYRFGEWGRVAGAYDPANEAIYALLVTGQFSGAATDQLYMHLCFVVDPYSPECMDAYHQEGLGGAALEEFTDESHEAEWDLGEDSWRLLIEGNVMTIRVFGADAA
jgi:hypothetical protein